MDKLTMLLGFLLALSLATERIVEILKGLPLLSGWLAVARTGAYEELRQTSVCLLAAAVAIFLAHQILDRFSGAFGLKLSGLWVPFVLGAMTSGGSGLWNSALDIAREVSKQKEALTRQLKEASERRETSASVRLAG